MRCLSNNHRVHVGKCHETFVRGRRFTVHERLNNRGNPVLCTPKRRVVNVMANCGRVLHAEAACDNAKRSLFGLPRWAHCHSLVKRIHIVSARKADKHYTVVVCGFRRTVGNADAGSIERISNNLRAYVVVPVKRIICPPLT
jgi:hypothetical protein